MTEHEKYEKLLDFVKSILARSCCNVCECISCDASKVLREIGFNCYGKEIKE